ncbi:ribosomal subunit 39S-domain-containing protein [Apodospora peruviana]|uniref:Large ribosomal subunit protein mL50 n=1 Tax=Apodospora peruviana TaxID=516989 RepID=A0AAE0I0X2_9PEZI|nr:ribosomal subunit 39S-domain-containing protein [Apodospora peruviana]
MRRLGRLRSSASALSNSTHPLRAPAPAVATFYSSQTEQPSPHTSAPRAWQSRFQTTQRRCLSSSSSSSANNTTADLEPTVEEDYVEEYDTSTESDLVYPREVVEVLSPEEITDPDYVPAETVEGLEEVGGLADWWDQEEHWGPSKQYAGFGPLEKVTEPTVLEVLTRRALVEALVIKRFAETAEKEATAAALKAVGGDKKGLLNIAAVELVAGEDGTLTLKDEKNFEGVWASLSSAEADAVPSSPPISTEEARKLVKTWDNEWKLAALRDPIVKFYVAKRIQRLTGHVVPDAKLLDINTPGTLYALLNKPPKPKKLAEVVQQTGALQDLPNVAFYPRRVTPVDKEQMVGRWKVIQRELQKRELPVTGTGKHSKTVEWKWAHGEH